MLVKAIRLLIISIIAGTIFGLIMLLTQYLTGLKVYTLLMNIDFIPILQRYTFPAVVEFMFHLVICVILTFLLASFMERFHWSVKQIFRYTIGINIAISVLYYPLTALSDRTPPLTSLPSFLLWVGVHILYGIVLAYLLVKEQQNGQYSAAN